MKDKQKEELIQQNFLETSFCAFTLATKLQNLNQNFPFTSELNLHNNSTININISEFYQIQNLEPIWIEFQSKCSSQKIFIINNRLTLFKSSILLYTNSKIQFKRLFFVNFTIKRNNKRIAKN